MYTYINKEQDHRNESSIYWFQCDFIKCNNKAEILGVCHQNGNITLVNNFKNDLSGSWYAELFFDLHLYVTDEMINDF
jgi:hypothetical protein